MTKTKKKERIGNKIETKWKNQTKAIEQDNNKRVIIENLEYI